MEKTILGIRDPGKLWITRQRWCSPKVKMVTKIDEEVRRWGIVGIQNINLGCVKGVVRLGYEGLQILRFYEVLWETWLEGGGGGKKKSTNPQPWCYIRLWNILMIQQKLWGGWRLNQCFKSELEICNYGNSFLRVFNSPITSLRNRLCQTWKAEIIQRDDDRWLVVVETRFDPVSATETQIDGASFSPTLTIWK